MTHRREAPHEPRAEEIASIPSTQTLALDDIAVGEHDETSAGTNILPAYGMRSAQLLLVDGRQATIMLRRGATPIAADVADDVEVELLALAQKNGDRVLVEFDANNQPLVVGVLQTRLPREVHIAADEVHLSAAKVLVLRAGRAAIKLHEDGEVELLGTKINAVSRGLFKIVGRVLRLN